MLATARTKEFVPCGMAGTVAVWSRAPPPLERFRAYALCMLQVLENVNSLGTSNLVPSPPPPIMDTEPPPAPSKPAASSSSSRRNTNTIPIFAGSAVASVADAFSIVFAAVVITTRVRRRCRQLNDGTDRDDDGAATAPPRGLVHLHQGGAGAGDQRVRTRGCCWARAAPGRCTSAPSPPGSA
jgi:hypothetical protein